MQKFLKYHKLLFSFIFLLSLQIFAVSGKYGGTASKYLTGNIIKDLSYNAIEKAIVTVTGEGLSYTILEDPLSTNITWYGYDRQSVFGDNAVITSAYPYKNKLYMGLFYSEFSIPNGGDFYVFDSNSQSSYFPWTDTSIIPYRFPRHITAKNNNIYFSSYYGSLIKYTADSIFTNANAWQCYNANPDLYITDEILFAYTSAINSLKNLLSFDSSYDSSNTGFDKIYLYDKLPKVNKTFHSFNTAEVQNNQNFLDSLSTSTSLYMLVTKFYIYSDSVVPDSLKASIYNGRILTKKDTIKFIDSSAAFINTQIDSLLSYSSNFYNQLLTDTIRTNLITAEEYHKNTSVTSTVYISLKSIPISNDTLLINFRLSTDNGISWKHLNYLPPFTSYPVVATASGDANFWLDTSSNKRNLWAFASNLDATARILTYSDNYFDSSYEIIKFNFDNIKDIAFFNDTLFIAQDYNNLSKLFFSDTTDSSNDIDSGWNKKEISMSGILEPEKGVHKIISVAINDTTHTLWIGTINRLYRKINKDTDWELFEFKKSISNNLKGSFTAPTILKPGSSPSQICYSLKEDGNVTINIFDFSMRKVKTIIENKPRKKGIRSDLSKYDKWDGRDEYGRVVSPGIYYVRITSDAGESGYCKIMVFSAINNNQ